jgi:hypothetical protein
MKHREDVYKLIENKTGTGVEVGVQFGNNLRHLCLNYSGCVHGVDIWKDDGAESKAKELTEGLNRVLITGRSVDVAKTYEDESLDFCYIDADHSYDHVKADFESWYPKVRKGGLFMGHDYGLNGDCEDVKKYIDELILQGWKFEFTTEDFFEGRPYQTWYLIK